MKHEGDAAFDLEVLDAVSISPRNTSLISTSLAMEIPFGFKGEIMSCSSLAKVGITAEGGLIDSGYHGEILAIIKNNSWKPAKFWPGNRFAQISFAPILTKALVEVQELSPSERAAGGFGSTGVNAV